MSALCLLAVLLCAAPVNADQARIAVAANFTTAAKDIAALFQRKTGHSVQFSFASTGQLFAQISQGAPFDAFLAADRERARKAVDDGYAVRGSAFTYAVGRLALFGKAPDLVQGPEILTHEVIHRIAIANPTTAPYGHAAMHTMQALGVHDAVAAKIVRGNNIAQTFQFVMSGNADIGFVALSQIAHTEQGSHWVVPSNLHPVIAQDAVLLKHGADNLAAKSFLAFLRGPEALMIKERYGYGSGD